ncbi:MAG: hypothetical protein KGJ23_13350 [Euryarchaeota archaeon]|nr:hypothetical protein [Euryarchaeota archaeon]MDE1837585.1 hypothetical protein [Euryarchaeota archaeon]MDE1881324.1 hypothetical protein [Euryarchaeota archaeon]MDE2045896.1 hypothetical protein [Thermoplasmata archaeon]
MPGRFGNRSSVPLLPLELIVGTQAEAEEPADGGGYWKPVGMNLDVPRDGPLTKVERPAFQILLDERAPRSALFGRGGRWGRLPRGSMPLPIFRAARDLRNGR